MRVFFESLKKRPLALLSFIVLCVLYLSMVFAEFAAPYPADKIFPDHSNHPPNLVFYSKTLGVGPQIQKRVLVNEINYSYARVRGEYYRVGLFVKGDEYRLAGFAEGNIHFFGTKGTEEPVFLFGADHLGRDLFSRIIYGSRISLTIGFIGVAISLSLAIMLGGLAGYYGGPADWLIMRFAEFFILIPGLYMILFLRSVLSRDMDAGQSYMVITVILSFVGWPGSARMIRGMVHSIKREDFVTAARLDGIPALVIIFRTIIPQLSSLLIVSIALAVPGFILGETVLSYLGLGITDPAVSWGSLINRNITTLSNLKAYPWFLVPGYFLIAVTLSFNFIADLLRDMSDPYFKGRGKT